MPPHVICISLHACMAYLLIKNQCTHVETVTPEQEEGESEPVRDNVSFETQGRHLFDHRQHIASSTPIRVVAKEIRYIHVLSLTLEHSMPISSPAAPVLTYPTPYVVVCIALKVVCFEGIPARPYIVWGGHGYMESLSRVLLESYLNKVR